MEKEKTKNNTGVIILLILIILGLVGYIVYDKALSNKEVCETNEMEQEENNETIKNDTEESILPKWAQYILEQNISKITVKRGINGYLDPAVGCPEDKQITKEELKQILEKMTIGKLTKHLDTGGFGGPCLTDIIIEYNDNKKTELFLYKFIVTKDKNVLSLLELEDYIQDNKRNSAMDDPYTLFEYDWDTSFVETLFE